MKPGDLFLVTSGEYSEKTIDAHARALKEFSFDERLAAYRQEQWSAGRPVLTHDFLQMLVAEGLIQYFDCLALDTNIGQPEEDARRYLEILKGR